MALHINIFGGPGTGKSTTRAKLFFTMKEKDYKVEEVVEYAKELTYGEDNIKLSDQLLLFAKQHHSHLVLDKKVDYIVTDSPFVMGLSYLNENSMYYEEFAALITKMYSQYNNINIFLERDIENHKYHEYGRKQTLQEAEVKDLEIKHMLIYNNIDFHTVKMGGNSISEILNIIKENSVSKLKHLILINGLKRSGKDYTANKIIEILGSKSCDIVSYATPMKDIIADTFNISLKDLEMYKNNNGDYGIEIQAYPNNQPTSLIKYINFREILQRFGTEGMKQQFGNKIWAKLGIKNAINKSKEVVIIPDFRFVDEYNVALKKSKKKGFTIHTINVFNDELSSDDNHASERDLSDNNFIFDYFINNTNQPDITEKIISILKSADILT